MPGQTPTARTNEDSRDLPDSPVDQEKMQEQEITIDMPEVKDIPGQENIVPPKMNAFADTTVSSDGEEGRGVVDDLNTESYDDPLSQ